MTGGGFEGGAYSGDWITSWVAFGSLLVFAFLAWLFFIKNDQAPAPWSVAGSLIGPLLALILISFFGWYKLAFLVGLAGLIIGGFMGGQWFGDST